MSTRPFTSTEAILSAGWDFPMKKKHVSIISIVLDAPMDVISALSGKLGRIPGVSTKALYAKAGAGQEQAKERK